MHEAAGRNWGICSSSHLRGQGQVPQFALLTEQMVTEKKEALPIAADKLDQRTAGSIGDE